MLSIKKLNYQSTPVLSKVVVCLLVICYINGIRCASSDNKVQNATASLNPEMRARSFYQGNNEYLQDEYESNNRWQQQNNIINSIQDGTIKVVLTRNTSIERNWSADPKDKIPSISYFGVIGLGTGNGRPQLFNVVFDTGSSETWVPYYTVWSIVSANNLHYKTGFECNNSPTCSSTSRKSEFSQWGTMISGRLIEDHVTLYEMMTKDEVPYSFGDKLELTDTAFIQAESASGDTDDTAEQFRYKPYDGIVGLKPNTRSEGGCRNLLYSLRQALPQYDQYAGFPLSFGLWINPNQQSVYGGELTLGGFDKSRVAGNRFVFHPTRNFDSWELSLNGVQLGSQRIGCPEGGCLASFETGINSIVGPRQEVDQIYSMLGTTFDDHLKIAQVNCDSVNMMPQLTIVLDNTPYILYPEHYIKRFRYGDDQICYLAIKPWDKSGRWIMGMTFIGSYYSLFDLNGKQIGFATAAN